MTTAQWLRAIRERLRADSGSLVAAGVAFYASLAVIPGLVIAVSLYGIFTSPLEAEAHVAALLAIAPDPVAAVLEAQMHPLADFSHLHLSLGLLISILALLWTVSNATRALVRAIVIANRQQHLRSPLEGRIASLGITLGVIVLATAAIGAIAAVPVWLAVIDPDHVIVSFGNLRWVLLPSLFAGGLLTLYRVALPERPYSWRAVLPGAIAATTMWMAISIVFSLYVSEFGRYNQTYGALGAAAALLLWLWLSSLAVIIGAHINVIRSRRNVPFELQAE